jgi:ACT domain-containing protein
MFRVQRNEAKREILNRFMKAYHKRFGVVLTIIKHRDKSDFEVLNPATNEKSGIEVTGFIKTQKKRKFNIQLMGDGEIFSGNLDEFAESLNTCLEQKARESKEYNFEGRLLDSARFFL